MFTFARCGVPMPGHLALQCRRSPDRPRPHEGLERRLASPRLVVDRRPSRRAARALSRCARRPRDRLGSSSSERGGVEGEAIQRAVVGRRSAPMGSACSSSSRGAHLQPETGRGTRVWWSWVSARAGRQPRLGAPEGGASESPRWSGRAVGSRRTVWRLGGRWDRPFAESPFVDHPQWTTPNESPSEPDSQDSSDCHCHSLSLCCERLRMVRAAQASPDSVGFG